MFLNAVETQVTNLLACSRQSRVYLVLSCEMERPDMRTGEVVTANPFFRSDTLTILDGTDVNEVYNDALDKMMKSMTTFEMCGSNWRFRSVVRLEINIIAYRPLSGNSYIPLPKKLADKKAIINPKNEDNQFFKWAVTRALNDIDQNAERIGKTLRKQAED